MNSPVKERPILFSGPMVRAILEGRKTQTRRNLKPQPALTSYGKLEWHGKAGPLKCTVQADGDKNLAEAFNKNGLSSCCPYGKQGDLLWVREAWRPDYDQYLEMCVQYAADCSRIKKYPDDDARGFVFEQQAAAAFRCETKGYKPSIYMPRWASRIPLEITGVRVERLQDISEADSWAEGAPRDKGLAVPVEMGENGYGSGWNNARSWYNSLWESINGKDSWDANPWVWVIEFKRVEPV